MVDVVVNVYPQGRAEIVIRSASSCHILSHPPFVKRVVETVGKRLSSLSTFKVVALSPTAVAATA